MALRLPLVMVNGEVQQLQAGDTIPGGAATIVFAAATLNLGSVAKTEHRITVVDAAATALSKAMITWGVLADADANSPDMDDVSFSARTFAAGSFVVLVRSEQPLCGLVKILYLLGA